MHYMDYVIIITPSPRKDFTRRYVHMSSHIGKELALLEIQQSRVLPKECGGGGEVDYLVIHVK